MEYEVEILLAEDNENDAELTMRALRKYNLANKLVHLKDGQEVIDFIFAEGEYSKRSVENVPKLILLDLKMSKLNGIQVLQRVKSDKRTKTIPVVALTSSSEDSDIKTCYELGVNSYLVKPVQFEDFIKVIHDLGLYWLLLNQPLNKDA